MVLDTSDEVVCTIGESPATVTVSCTVDSCIAKFSTTFWPALKTRFCRTCVAKPAISTLHTILAFGRQRAHHVAAVLAGGHRPRQAGGGVGDGHGDARQHRLLRVGDDAFDVERGVLRECRHAPGRTA